MRDDDDDGQALLDERDGPVLELSGREPLGVHVGELLELERAFEGDRVADVPPDEEDGVVVGEERARSRTGSIVDRTLPTSSEIAESWRTTVRISSPHLVPRTWPR